MAPNPPRYADEDANELLSQSASWENQAIELSESMEELQQYKKRFELLDRVAHAQAMHLRGESKVDVFQCLLDGLLALMNSQYGFIGSVQYEQEDGSPYLLAHAFTNVAWTKASHAFCESCIPTGLKFCNMNNLWGSVITSKEPVICNNLSNDPRSVGTPKGHPKIDSFLGIPFFKQEGELIGMVGIANKEGGYTESDLGYLEPFCVTCSSLIQSYKQQDENRLLIDTLEQSVQERTKKLQQANDELEAANRKITNSSKQQLQHFAMMSHQLKTPMNCMIGLSSLLFETPLNSMQKESVRMMLRSGELLSSVVTDVLDYSKLETGNVGVEIRKESLQDILDTVVRAIETEASEKNVSLVMDCEASVHQFIETDGRRLSQILLNLLHNAVKFSRPDMQIGLGIRTIEKDDTHSVGVRTVDNASTVASTLKDCQGSTEHCVRFEVVDHGKGIHEDDFDKIFEPFMQADEGLERIYSGNGLGLAVVKKLVEELGGEILVASELGSFTKFTLDLPNSKKHIVDIQSVAEKLASVRLLLVGADETTKSRIQACSEAFGYTFLVASDLPECEQMLGRDKGCFEHTVLVLHESLLELYENKEKSDDSTILLSFGPKFVPSSAVGHYRSISNVVPHVFVVSLLDRIAKENENHKCGESEEILEQATFQYSNLNVLIAEDNLVNQKVLTGLLKRIGVKTISVVDNGKKAVDACKEQAYDIILLDYEMPVLNGIDACRQILQSSRDRTPQIAFVSAQSTQSFRKECQEAGSSYFLSKPVTYHALETLLCTLSEQQSR